MARLCEPCRFHTPDDAVTACATCGGPVKFTLLPPVNGDAEPVAGLPSTKAELSPPPFDLRELFRGKAKLATSLAVAGFVAAAVTLYWTRSDSFEERAAKVRPGMSMATAMDVMGKPRKAKKKYTISFGDTGMERFEDFDRAFDVSGDGIITYEKGINAVWIHYERGLVTRVELKDAVGGMRKRYSVSDH